METVFEEGTAFCIDIFNFLERRQMPVLPLKLSSCFISAWPVQSSDLCVVLLETELAVGSCYLLWICQLDLFTMRLLVVFSLGKERVNKTALYIEIGFYIYMRIYVHMIFFQEFDYFNPNVYLRHKEIVERMIVIHL